MSGEGSALAIGALLNRVPVICNCGFFATVRVFVLHLSDTLRAQVCVNDVMSA